MQHEKNERCKKVAETGEEKGVKAEVDMLQVSKHLHRRCKDRIEFCHQLQVESLEIPSANGAFHFLLAPPSHTNFFMPTHDRGC